MHALEKLRMVLALPVPLQFWVLGVICIVPRL
jgi:hypothetical protein